MVLKEAFDTQKNKLCVKKLKIVFKKLKIKKSAKK
jgi:hypothetical protein